MSCEMSSWTVTARPGRMAACKDGAGCDKLHPRGPYVCVAVLAGDWARHGDRRLHHVRGGYPYLLRYTERPVRRHLAYPPTKRSDLRLPGLPGLSRSSVGNRTAAV